MTPTPLFSELDYARLANIVFRPDYPGNATARGVVEAPNGDGARDNEKRYSHVAEKYIVSAIKQSLLFYEDNHALTQALIKAHKRATQIAGRLGVPSEFFPAYDHGCLRVLEHPPGAGGPKHTDFDLFAVDLYRNVTNPGLG